MAARASGEKVEMCNTRVKPDTYELGREERERSGNDV
jgi:hypothetical protein